MRYSITLLLLLAVSISFANTNGKLVGRVKDTKGKPLGYANIVLFQDGKQITGRQAKHNGRYQVTNIDPGVYDIRYTLTGYTKLTIEHVRIEADKTVKLNPTLMHNSEALKLKTASAKVPVTVQELIPLQQDSTMHLRCEKPIDLYYGVDSTHELKGRVVNSKGRRIQNAKVALMVNGHEVRKVITGRNGAFQFGYFAPNPFKYSIAVKAAGYSDKNLDNLVFDVTNERIGDIILQETEAVKNEGLLTGRITDRKGMGISAKAAKIYVDGIYTEKGLPDADGIYQIAGLATGKHKIRIQVYDNYGVTFKGIKIIQGRITTLNYHTHLKPGQALNFDILYDSPRNIVDPEQTGSVRKVHPEDYAH